MSRILSNFSARFSNTPLNTPKRCHITMAKQPYRFTNKKGYEIQVCLQLDRREKIDLFATYLEWKIQGNTELQGREAPGVNIPASDADDIPDWQLRREKFLPFARAFIPQPPRDAFQDPPTVSPRNDTTRLFLPTALPIVMQRSDKSLGFIIYRSCSMRS